MALVDIYLCPLDCADRFFVCVLFAAVLAVRIRPWNAKPNRQHPPPDNCTQLRLLRICVKRRKTATHVVSISWLLGSERHDRNRFASDTRCKAASRNIHTCNVRTTTSAVLFCLCQFIIAYAIHTSYIHTYSTIPADDESNFTIILSTATPPCQPSNTIQYQYDHTCRTIIQ